MNTEPDALAQLIDAATPALDEGPKFDETATFLVDHACWWAEQRRRLRHVRRLIIGGALAYAGFLGWVAIMVMDAVERTATTGPVRMQLSLELAGVAAIPVALVGFALWLAHRRGELSQVLSRALLWSFTVIVGLLQWRLNTLWHRGPDPEFPIVDSMALLGTLVCVGALLLLGNHGLKSPRATGFRRTPLHGLLTLSLVMGLADAVLLAVAQLVMGGLSTVDPVVVLLCVWLVVSAIALYRLRTWGLVAMILGNIAELVLASEGMLNGASDFVIGLILTAVVQLVLPLPLLRAMVRRSDAAQPLPKFLGRLPSVVLFAIAAMSVWGWLSAVIHW